MRRALVFFATLSVAAAIAPAALGSPATVTSVDLPVAGHRSLTVHRSASRFTLVGIHWRGPGKVLFRTHSMAGRWTAWRAAAPEDDDGPDPGSRERRLRAGWRIGNPWWVGPSDSLQTRTVGRVSQVRAYLVWSPEVQVPYRVPAVAAAAATPTIVPRLSWGADESIRRAPPVYAPSLRFAVVHHTAGQNNYTRAEAPAIVKGIELYHVKGNGWNDIGYNFLVDRFGTIYEGRYGGIDRNVIGAHALGFNTGSVGVAVLGTYGNTAPSQAAQNALEKLLAWRLDLAHVDPLGLLTVISGGSERYPRDVPVLLRAISGHRDTGYTECPGDAFYARLDAIAAATAAIGLPKIYAPRVDMTEVGARFRARLSSAVPWVVTITDRTGAQVARGTGTGTAVDWTWDASSVPVGVYSWSIRAGRARPASGTLKAGSSASALAITSVVADPAALNPNGDEQADASLLTFSLTIPANVSVELVSASGDLVTTVVDRTFMSAGLHEIVVDGSSLPDGNYSIVVTARTAAGAEVQSEVPLTVSRTLGTVSVAPDVFSPNGDGRRDRLTISFSLVNPAQVGIRILRDGRWVATPLQASLLAGSQDLVWDGIRHGGPIRDASYTAVVDVTDAVGTVSVAVPFVSDTTAPTVRMLPGRSLRIAVSEPAVLHLKIDGELLRKEVPHAGVVRISLPGPASRARVVAWDAAGNVSAPVVRVAKQGPRGSGQ
jgi:hypothetical protein